MLPFAETIVLWRGERGLSQLELATRAGIARPNLSAIEAGRRDVSLAMLRRLASALDVNPGTLADGIPPTPVRPIGTDRPTLERIATAAAQDNASPLAADEQVVVDLLRKLTASRRAAHRGRAHKSKLGPRSAARLWVRLQAMIPGPALDSLLQRTLEKSPSS